MKKNITINLFGSLYAIDEDAYELLKKYEESLRAYFSKQEGGDEIADDLERRVAELFEELKAQGVQAINIEHVQDIIKRIGNPEQMNEDGEATASEEAPKNEQETPRGQQATVKRKLFRDPNDKMLGGVMSGLAHYLGGEVLLWRILVILLCFFTSFVFLLIYIACWILIPEAHTTEDFLMMSGKVVSPDTIAQAVVDEQTVEKQPQNRTFLNGLLSVCGVIVKIMLFAFAVVFAFVCGIVLIVGIILLILFLFAVAADSGTLLDMFNLSPEMVHAMPAVSKFTFVALCTSFLMFLGIPIYCTIHHLMRYGKKTQPMSFSQRVVWIVMWIASFVILVASSIGFVKQVQNASRHGWTTHVYLNHTEEPDMLEAFDAEDVGAIVEGVGNALATAIKAVNETESSVVVEEDTIGGEVQSVTTEKVNLHVGPAKFNVYTKKRVRSMNAADKNENDSLHEEL